MSDAPVQNFQWIPCPQCDKYTRMEFLDGECETKHAPYCGPECEDDANPIPEEEDDDEDER